MFNRNNQARLERNQEKMDAGFVSKHFPEVASIVISMIYKQRGSRSLLQTLNYFPDSYALFKVACLSRDCADNRFDMTHIITSMIRNHSAASRGELAYDDNSPRPDHSNVVYDIAIQYT